MSRFTLAGLLEHVSSGALGPFKLEHLSTMGSSSQVLPQNPEGHFQKALSRQEAGAATSRRSKSRSITRNESVGWWLVEWYVHGVEGGQSRRLEGGCYMDSGGGQEMAYGSECCTQK